MCLKYDKASTKKFWNTKGRKNKDWCWAYKIYSYFDGKLYPIYTVVHQDYEPVTPGYIISNREYKSPFVDWKDSWNDDEIHRGIHVFTDSKRVGYYKQNRFRVVSFVTVRVKCFKKDFVASSDTDRKNESWKLKGNEAVFMKIFLPKEEYEAALKRKKEKK